MARVSQSLALVAAGGFFAFLLFELFLRAIGYSAPLWGQPDPQLGWRLRPGLEARYTDEGDAFVRINSAGWRDREHTLGKPEGAYRIAVLGDSYSEARQVPVEKTFWAMLPEKLERCGFQRGRRIESINFGVSGYSTAQQYLLLKSEAIRYRPDLVLLQFTNGNDVADNSYAVKSNPRPFFRLGSRGELRLDASFAASAQFRRRSSSTASLVRDATNRLRVLQMVRAVREIRLERHADGVAAVEQGLEPLVLKPPQDEKWREAWQVTEALIAATRDYAAAHGARFLIMTVPYAVQVDPRPEVRRAVQDKLGVPDLLYPDRRIARFAERSGIDALTLASAMQRVAEENGTYLHGFPDTGMGRGHWNESGHRVGAELVARHLCAGEPRPVAD